MSAESAGVASPVDDLDIIDQLRALALFDGLATDQLRELRAAGDLIRFDRDEVLFREARPAENWWLLLDGSLDLSRHTGHEDTVIGTMSTPGQWAGGFRAWDPHGVYMATCRGRAAGRVLRVPADRLGELANSWFPFGVHLIRGLTQTVRNIETMARQREALVSLGTLAAGLAHEINNPASAATRAVDALQETSEQLTSTLVQLAGSPISAEQFIALDRLRRRGSEQPAAMDPLAVARREDAISDWLVQRDIDRDWVIGPPLAAAGLDVAWCEQVEALLGEQSAAVGLEWVANSLTMETLLAEVKESTRRISDLVGVVKSYSQMDRASIQIVDVTEGLDSTLAILAGRTSGLEVIRDYAADLPSIEANAGELNQVWTNVVDNAIDAMDGSGTLRVSTRADQSFLLIEIADNGTGMTPDVAKHAFDPFFTTKEVGKGTGLGLDISRRIIVDRHGGAIEIDSSAGETVLRVRLPLPTSGGQ